MATPARVEVAKLTEQLLTSTGELKCKHTVKYSIIEEKVVAFVILLRNRSKPLPISLSIIREYAEQVAISLGEKDFKLLLVGGKR